MSSASSLGLGLGIAAIVILVAIFLLSKSIYIVQQAEAIVIERLGRFHRVLSSGIHFIIPFVDSPKVFTWRKTEISSSGKIKDTVTSLYRIDQREAVFNFLRQEAFTKDTVQVNVNAVMYYSISDVFKAIYEVDDLQAALSNTAQTQVREVFGDLTFAQALGSQAEINAHLTREFEKLFLGWGVKVIRMEMLDLSPDVGIQENMKKQMMAERSRRGAFIASEGQKASMRLRADGAKGVSVNMGLAKQESTRKRSEGELESTVLETVAERNALESLSESFRDDGTSQSSYLIAQRYIALLGSMMKGAKQHVYLPYELSSVRGLVGGLASVFGRGTDGEAGEPRRRTAGRSDRDLD